MGDCVHSRLGQPRVRGAVVTQVNKRQERGYKSKQKQEQFANRVSRERGGLGRKTGRPLESCAERIGRVEEKEADRLDS